MNSIIFIRFPNLHIHTNLIGYFSVTSVFTYFQFPSLDVYALKKLNLKIESFQETIYTKST